MKQYGGILKKLMGFILATVMLFSFTACNETESGNAGVGSTQTPGETGTAVMTIHGYEISQSEYTIMLYDAAVELKMEAEPEEEMTDEEYQEWFFNFYNIPIDGKMPFDIARENVLVDLREYAYYMQAVKAAGLSMSEADRNDIETNVLITVGDEYDPENPDDYFIYTYGITKDQYVDYLVNLALIDIYVDDMAMKEDVKVDDITAYRETYRSHYTVWSIQNIYLAASTEDEFTAKQTLGDSLAQRVQNGEDMTQLVKQYTEDGGDGEGIFIVSKDEWNYPSSILDWVYAAQVNDVGVVRAEDGIYVLKCVKMDVEENAVQEIHYVLGMEQFRQRVSTICQGEEYAPQLNASVYNAFTKLPGDLMMSDNAVG